MSHRRFRAPCAAGRRALAGAIVAAALVSGCVRNTTLDHPPGDESDPSRVSEPSVGEFDAALEELTEHDRTGWSEADCERVARRFLEMAERHRAATDGILAEAHYNAALAYERCDRRAAAKEQLGIAAQGRDRLLRASARLAVYSHEASGDLDATIAELERLVREGKFQDVETLVHLAALQMQRGHRSGRRDDYAEAKRNLQRALAIDDDFVPAMNQLALYYLELARARATRIAGGGRGQRRPLVLAGSKRLRGSREQLELAALVVDQAIRKRPDYAPIHNTGGLIAVELEDLNTAVDSFGR